MVQRQRPAQARWTRIVVEQHVHQRIALIPFVRDYQDSFHILGLLVVDYRVSPAGRVFRVVVVQVRLSCGRGRM